MSENKEIAIQISGVKKKYKLGQIGGGTLQGDLQSWWARVRGKEDPNSKIGQDNRLIGQTFMALNGIDLTVYKGEALGIIGGNGAGKSTLLKLLSRVTAPTDGEIDIYGRITSMLEVGTGFNGEMTGRENIYMNGAILGMTKSEIDTKIEDIIEFSEVRDFIDTPVKRYSSGMYVKLAFAVAAHLDSEIMIMDEVLAVGDMKFQQKCLGKMDDVSKHDGRTVLYVSHNMNTIRQLCDRCIVLDKGKVVFDGDVEKGIGVYLGKNADLQQSKSFLNFEHPKWYTPKLTISQVIIKNDAFSIYCGDPLELKVKFTAHKNASCLRARLVIMDDNEVIIGMAISENEFSIQENKTGEFCFAINTEMMSAARYTTRFSVFEINTFGNHDYACVINNFIAFEIQDKPSLHHGMTWDKNSWGRIAFPDFNIKVN